jgi:hypothetical protein
VKKQLIEVGKTYHNGKQGRYYSTRKVIAAGREYVLYNGQEDIDCLRYLQIKGRNSGREFNITRTSFAQWAKGEVKEREGTE